MQFRPETGSRSSRALYGALAVALLSFTATSCIEPPPHLKTPVAVAKMTREEKKAVVAKALAEAERIEADPDAVQPSEIDWRTELAEMKAVLRPNDALSDALERAFAEHDFEVQLWMKSENYARLLAIETQLRQPITAEDKDAHKALKEEARPLRAEFRQLADKHRTRILTTMGEENRLKWTAHRLTERMRGIMSPLKLTDEQVAELRSRAWHTVERSAGAPKPPQFEREAFLQLEKQMEREVLGPGQQRKYETVKQENPNRSL
ncbi:MAG: hypothetical protein AB7O26_13180 [Planctomycetaceae bacterium]